MAGLDSSIRNAELNQIVTLAGTSALLRLYSGVQPATGAAVGGGNVLLSQHTCSAVLGTVSAGVLTFNSVAAATAVATGTATWARLVKSDGVTFVADFSVGPPGSGADITSTPNANVTATGTVTVTNSPAPTITAGNP